MEFSEWLRRESAPAWEAAVRHRFVDELLAGTVAEEVMRRYLVQDYQFVDRFVALLGGCVSNADRIDSRMEFARQLGVVAGAENDYFQRAFDALAVPDGDRAAPALLPATRSFNDLMDTPRAADDYPGCLAVLTVAEWLYADWAARAPERLPESFLHAEWITLHNTPAFHAWVRWLRMELDRVGATLDASSAARVRDLFVRAAELERDFFAACYA